ncbi:MAG: sulfatase [Proteobacteria bacterium]|nr:sulfatase [Pseudomonadota bacterium]
MGASLAELHGRLGAQLIPMASDYAGAVLRLLPSQAGWAAAGVAVVGLARWAWGRARALPPWAIAVAAAIDGASRQVLGEAWLGAVVEERLTATIGPAVLYFGLLPTAATLLALVGLILVPSRAVAATAIVGAAAACLAPAGAAPEPAPNLLLVTIDTWRYDHLGAHPAAVDPDLTPTLDALADRGWLFTEARAHVPITVPSHTSMLSGRTPWEHGSLTNGGRVHEDLPWLPEDLQDAGYATGAVVSGGVIRGSRGFARGFDRFHDDLRSPPAVDDLVGLRLVRLLRGEDDPKVFRAQAPRATRRAGAFLNEVPADTPWFLWVHLYDVHLPHTVEAAASAPFLDSAFDGLPDPCAYKDHPVPVGGPAGMSLGPRAGGPNAEREAQRRCGHLDSLQRRLASYRAEVRVADAAVAELLSMVEARGETERTAVIVTADHGESLTEHGMRVAHQFSAYEPVLRVPLIVVPPGGSTPRTSGVLVQHRDLATTAAQLLNREPPTDDGRSWIDGAGVTQVGSVTHVPFLTVRRGLGRSPDGAPRQQQAPVRVAVRDGASSIVFTPGLPTEVYDLLRDPGQASDLASAQGSAPPPDLLRAAQSIVSALSERSPETLDVDDPDLEAMRALGYVE